jgi:predicted TPR repeat methyltransferase
MATSRKKTSIGDTLKDLTKGLREVFVEQPARWLEEAQDRARNLPKTNFDLGCDFAASGSLMDALFRFRVTAMLRADYPDVWYNIGCCYHRMNKLQPAIAALKKAYAQRPGDDKTRLMLAALDPSAIPVAQRPQSMPVAMIKEFFAAAAANYDVSEAANGYRGGKAVADVLAARLPQTGLQVVDLGCGTGIAARPWRASAAHLTGIDLTPEMLAVAGKATHAERPLFDSVIEADVRQLPESLAPQSADLVLMVHVLPYLGAAKEVLAQIALLLKPGGISAVTFQASAASSPSEIDPATGQFKHSPAALKQEVATSGLAVVAEQAIELYGGQTSSLLVLQKPTAPGGAQGQ